MYYSNDSDRNKSLKDYSLLAYLVERFFRFLQFLPPQVILSNRTDVQKFFNTLDNKRKNDLTRRRARIVDLYISLWLIFEMVSACIIVNNNLLVSSSFKIIVIVLLIIRIVDIIQVNVNLSVFDYLRNKQVDYVVSLVRVLVNTIINYFEIVMCFGIFYLLNLNGIKNAKSWFDGFYFSITTQLTIGYGDLSPIGINKLIASIQGLLGFFFSLIIIGRIIALFPQVRSVMGDDKQ